MLRQLPDEAKSCLLKIINRIWETRVLPKGWKIAIVLAIQKLNKDPHYTSSYRPIALTSCVCKLMEKMVNSRLGWHLEAHNLLSPVQFGFRKNRSTLDPLLRLSNQIQQGFANQCQIIGVFFDLEKAYDTTWRHGVIKQLQNMEVKGNMIRFIRSFLSDRSIKVRVGNTLSSLFKLMWVPHLKAVKTKCMKALEILRVLSHTTWISDRKTLLRLHHSFILSKLSYGCEVFSSATVNRLKILNTIHHSGVRLSTGAFKSSPISSLLVDACELPLDLYLQSLLVRYWYRLQSLPDSLALKAVNSLAHQNATYLHPSTVAIAINGDAIRVEITKIFTKISFTR